MDETVSRSSMLYWWPRVENIEGIRKPKTILIATDTLKCLEFLDGDGWPLDVEDLKSACERIGYPVFMRTDHCSGKHSWNETCFVYDAEHLLPNLTRLIDGTCMADLPIDAIAIREYIPMKTLFCAFYGKMPVNPEIRLFARDGRIECRHWYWIPDAIKKSGAPVIDIMGREMTEDAWRFHLTQAQFVCETDDPGIDILTDEASRVASRFEGYWSMDFCLSARGDWVLIDMAEGERSWHPEHKP